METNNDLGIPYFMQNDDWYYYDEKEEIYKLTEKAPEKARQSYEKFYKESEND